MLRSVFSSRARQWQLQDLSLFPFPQAPQQTLKKQLSVDLEFHNFGWLGFAGSFFRAGLYRELTSQGGFYPLLPYLPLPSIFIKLNFCSLRGRRAKHFKPTSGAGSDRPTSRAGSPSAPQTGATRLQSLRSTCCSLAGQVSHSSHIHQPGGCDTASPSLGQASSPFLPVHSSALPHRCGCLELHK